MGRMRSTGALCAVRSTGALCAALDHVLGGKYFFIILTTTVRKLRIKFCLRQWIFNNDLPNIRVISEISPPSKESSLAAHSYFPSSNTSLAALELCKPASDCTNDTVTLPIIKHSNYYFILNF